MSFWLEAILSILQNKVLHLKLEILQKTFFNVSVSKTYCFCVIGYADDFGHVTNLVNFIGQRLYNGPDFISPSKRFYHNLEDFFCVKEQQEETPEQQSTRKCELLRSCEFNAVQQLN